VARTDEAQLRLIIDTRLDASALESFIADASLWVDNNLASDGLSDATLEAIERWLAAGFATSRDPRLTDKTLLSVKESLQRDPIISEYFKRAADLDPTGKVASAFVPTKRVGLLRIGAGYDTRHRTAGL
jgi:hypothetical protein